MLEWAEGVTLLISAASSSWIYLQSNFATAVLGSLAGAFGGAWAAQKIANRSKLREELLKEIRNTNAAASMVYGVANTHLGLKKQHVKSLREKYDNERTKFDRFLEARSAGTVPPRQVFTFDADLQMLKPLYSPTEQIQKLIFDQISLSGPIVFVVPVLVGCIQALAEALTERNRLIEEWKANSPTNFPYVYFGAPQENATDQRYKTTIDAIYTYTDDVIAFSIMIGDALYKHGMAQRKRYREQFRDDGPGIIRMEFPRSKELLPPADRFKDFTAMLETVTPASDVQIKLLQRFWPFKRRVVDTAERSRPQHH